MRIPGLGKCLQLNALTRMSWALSVAVESGMNAREIIRTALRATNNIYYLRHEQAVDRQIQQGREIHEALRITNALPDDFLQSVEIGEQSGRLAETMDKLSEQYQQQSKAASGGMIAVAAIATWGLVAIVLITLIFRVFSFYTGMIQSVAEF